MVVYFIRIINLELLHYSGQVFSIFSIWFKR